MKHTQEFLPKLRKTAGMSQDELARKLGMSRPTLVAVEKGERDITVGELAKISEIFDIPAEILFDENMSVSQKVSAQDFSEKSFQKFRSLVRMCVKFGADDDGKITKTKLAKLVYLCDFASYYQHLKPISGFEYHKLAQGPVPIEFFDVLDTDESFSLEKKGTAMMVALVEQPDEGVLSAAEQKLIRAVCKKWQKASTSAIVEFTHKQIPWKVCRDREVIPYALINNESPENVY